MKKRCIRFLLLVLVIFVTTMYSAGCGKAMTDEQFEQRREEYYNGEIDAEYYDEVFEAYYDEEPMPSQFWYSIKKFIKNVFMKILGLIVTIVVFLFVWRGLKK